MSPVWWLWQGTRPCSSGGGPPRICHAERPARQHHSGLLRPLLQALTPRATPHSPRPAGPLVLFDGGPHARRVGLHEAAADLRRDVRHAAGGVVEEHRAAAAVRTDVLQYEGGASTHGRGAVIRAALSRRREKLRESLGQQNVWRGWRAALADRRNHRGAVPHRCPRTLSVS